MLSSISAAVALGSTVPIRSSATVPIQVKMPRVQSPLMQMGEDGVPSLWDRTIRRAQQREGSTGPRFSNQSPYDAVGNGMRDRAAHSHGSSFQNPSATRDGLEAGWVMIFNAGQPNEGVYTHTSDEGSAVLAFECTDDANDYAQLLLAKGFDLAVPLFWSADRLSTFCQAAGFEVSVVPRGTMPMQPSNQYDPMNDFNHLGGAGRKEESMFESAQRRDEHTSNQKWLENLFHQPDCGDDDCKLR